MEISGAIFDCDGTLVDSMPMWRDVYEWAYDRYGTARLPIERIEALSTRDTCELFHDELGMGESGEEVYETLMAHVREEYARVVWPFDGVRRFLDELAAAGVPMIVASSTPVRELRFCLEAHGLAGYFQDVVSTEDVGGRDKEFPDVYLEALRRLGTPRETTWVFEDAPFGVRTSRKAGFAVVGLMNDHDGRREEDVRPWCDLYVHGYAELSRALIADYERPAKETDGVLKALVIDGSPERSSNALVRRLVDEADYVVCADAGAAACREAGVVPDAFCGDFDSADEPDIEWARTAAKTTIHFPAEKYTTDLGLAIDCAVHEAARRRADLWLTVTCAAGGRPDHAICALYQLAAAPAARAREVEDGFELRILSGSADAEWELGAAAEGHTFSLASLAEGTLVTERGTRWELERRRIDPVQTDAGLAVSNVVVAPDALVRVDAGLAACYLIA